MLVDFFFTYHCFIEIMYIMIDIHDQDNYWTVNL